MSDGNGGGWTLVVQAFLIVFGWVVVHYLSNKRDKAKARREMAASVLEGVGAKVDALLWASLDYHTKARDEAAERRLTMGLQDIAHELAELRPICASSEDLTACRTGLGRFRRTMTEAHFADEHVNPILSTDPQLQGIAASALDLKKFLLRLQFKQFPE